MRDLEPVRTLDVACGTGFLTRLMSGAVTAIDQSEAMVQIASARMPHAHVLKADAVPLPFADGEFDRVFTSHFYGHLLTDERERFLAEARRVAGELVVVDSAVRPGVEPEQWQERQLNAGTVHRVYKRYFTGGLGPDRRRRGALRGRLVRRGAQRPGRMTSAAFESSSTATSTNSTISSTPITRSDGRWAGWRRGGTGRRAAEVGRERGFVVTGRSRCADRVVPACVAAGIRAAAGG